MTLRSWFVVVCAAAAAALGCSADRPTAPTQTDLARAADEIEREATELALVAGPAAALTYQSAAVALRQGAPITTVDITVDGTTAKWNAFGHEVIFTLPTGSAPQILEPPPPMRALLAWRAGPAGTLRMVHLLAEGEGGPIGSLPPIDLTNGPPQTLPSFLMYAEARDLLWQGISGSQTNKLTSTGAACPAPASPPAGAPPLRQCVEATFRFGFSDVRAQPFAVRFATGAPSNRATGTRTLSMAEQTVSGVQVRITLAPNPFVPAAGWAAR